MRRACTALALLTLTACAHGPAAEPEVKIVEVPKPIRVSCVPAGFRDPPAYPSKEQLRQSPGAGDMLQAVTAAYILLDQWVREAAPVLKGCR